MYYKYYLLFLMYWNAKISSAISTLNRFYKVHEMGIIYDIYDMLPAAVVKRL